MSYRIENKDRPGHYWSSHFAKFCSEFGDDYKVYKTQLAAMRVAQKLSKSYNVAVQEYSAQQRAFEVASGMHGRVGSAAEKESTARYEYWVGGEKRITKNKALADQLSTCDIREV